MFCPCKFCGVLTRISPPTCAECGEPLAPGDHYYMTLRVPGREDEPRRVWHKRCMDASYRSLSEYKLYQRARREMRDNPRPPSSK